MKNKLKSIINNNRTIISNFSYLSVLQVVNLLFPMLTYPYLIRVLGAELYGLVVFTLVVATYFNVFITFGFTMLGAKEVSINRNNVEKLSEIVSVISLIKIVFLMISFIILFCYFYFFDAAYKVLYFLAFWVCISDIIFPQWFFQGIEKMKFITIISLISKLVFLVLVFILIKSEDDILWFPFSNLIAVFISGFFSIYLIRKEGICFLVPSFVTIKSYLKNSLHFFLQSVITQVYANSNKAIIGAFLGLNSLAYYDLAEKIVNIVRVPQGILSQVVFPRIVVTKSISFVKKVFNVSMLMNIGLYLLLFFFAKYIVLFLGGNKMIPAVPVVRLLGLLVPIVAVSNVYGINTLIAFGFNKLFTKMIFYSVIIFLGILGTIWLVGYVTLYSLAIVNVLSEFILSLIAIYFVYRENILLWKKNTII